MQKKLNASKWPGLHGLLFTRLLQGRFNLYDMCNAKIGDKDEMKKIEVQEDKDLDEAIKVLY